MNEIRSVGLNQGLRLAPLFTEGLTPHLRNSSGYSEELSDRLELSDRALALAEPRKEQDGGGRSEKLDHLRNLIELGLYESPERIAVTADRLLDVLNPKSEP